MKHNCINCEKELDKTNIRFCNICWSEMCKECYVQEGNVCKDCKNEFKVKED